MKEKKTKEKDTEGTEVLKDEEEGYKDADMTGA